MLVSRTLAIDFGMNKQVIGNERERFSAIQRRLPDIWRALREDDSFEHTSVIVPSLSVNQEELTKVQGPTFYEERLMFVLIRLRNPNARLIYVTSQPVHPDVVDYYLQFLGVSESHACFEVQRRMTFPRSGSRIC